MKTETEKQALALAIREERHHLHAAMEQLRTATRAEVARAKERFGVVGKLRAHPVKAIAIAFAVGFALAFTHARRAGAGRRT